MNTTHLVIVVLKYYYYTAENTNKVGHCLIRRVYISLSVRPDFVIKNLTHAICVK